VTDKAVLAAARSIRTDRVHGAMELALAAVESAVALLAAYPERDLRHVAQALMTARPSMAAIGNAVAVTLAPVVGGSVDRQGLREQVRSLREEWTIDTERLTAIGIQHIPRDLLTYSHSSTTRNALLACMGAVLVGADTAAPDGSVYNHMGTATLALLAREYGTPIYSLTHTIKIAPYDRPTDMDEENDPGEVWTNAPTGITVRNPAFDRTPADQITVLTERGILTDALRATLVAAHRTAWETVGLLESW
jgi:translation initiation factor 2B subunit (eIF-2B alpha/beta/delta family)